MADSSRDQADLPSTSTSDQDAGEKRILAQFKSEDGELVATPFDLPIDVTQEGLQLICNAALQNVSLSDGSTERKVPLCMCLSLVTCISYSCFSMHPHQHTHRDWTERHNCRKQKVYMYKPCDKWIDSLHDHLWWSTVWSLVSDSDGISTLRDSVATNRATIYLNVMCSHHVNLYTTALWLAMSNIHESMHLGASTGGFSTTRTLIVV